MEEDRGLEEGGGGAGRRVLQAGLSLRLCQGVVEQAEEEEELNSGETETRRPWCLSGLFRLSLLNSSTKVRD